MGTVAHLHHVCQVYADEEAFLDSLGAFVGTGLRMGQAVIVIATPAHRAAVAARLGRVGHDVGRAFIEDQLIMLDAEETLSQFMLNGWPDADRFARAIAPVIARARRAGRDVRAFGEMVALLWNGERYAATLRLEELWNQLLANEHFLLFCAYPRACLDKGERTSVSDIYAAHARILAA
jgi:hypothetical protein